METKKNTEIQKKIWEAPDFKIIATDIRTGTTPGTKEFDDGLGHLYSS
jgi:hypothetical protein